MQKRIVLVLAILFIASIAVFAQDTTSDDLFAGVDGNVLTAEEMTPVVGERLQQALKGAWKGLIQRAIREAISGAFGFGAKVVPGAIVGDLGGMFAGFVVSLFKRDVDPEIVRLKQELAAIRAVIFALSNGNGSWNDVGVPIKLGKK